MDPAVASAEQTTNMPDSALDRVRSVDGVLSAVPLALGAADARFPNGRFQPFQIIGVDDATLSSVPPLRDGASPVVLRSPNAAIVDPGGTEGKLETPFLEADQWPLEPHLEVPTRTLNVGDELLVNDSVSKSRERRKLCRGFRRDRYSILRLPTPTASSCQSVPANFCACHHRAWCGSERASCTRRGANRSEGAHVG